MSFNVHLGKPHLTAIASAKGGTGKTFIAVTLAHALAQQGERVLLCDADFGLSNTQVHLGLDDCGDLAGFLSDDLALGEAMAPVLGGAGMGGFDIIAAPCGSGEFANPTELGAQRLLAKLKSARAYDRVLIDLAAGVDAPVMRFAATADDLLLAITPDPAALTDAFAFIKLLRRMRANGAPQVLVNMTLNDAEARRTAATLSATCKAFLKTMPDYAGAIPHDCEALDAVRRQTPLLDAYPESRAAAALKALACRLHWRLRPGIAPLKVVGGR